MGLNMEKITSKEVKKGAMVTTTDGRRGEVMDNKVNAKTARMLKIPVLGMDGMHDIGDTYIHEWSIVEQDGNVYQIELTEAQKSLKEKLDSMGW
jgi:hypothetical protein